MVSSGFRRGALIAIAAFLLIAASARAPGAADGDFSAAARARDTDLVLPDGRPLPELPVQRGAWSGSRFPESLETKAGADVSRRELT